VIESGIVDSCHPNALLPLAGKTESQKRKILLLGSSHAREIGPKLQEHLGTGYEVTCIFIDIDIFVNCNWVDTRWQYTFTHKQYIEHHN
jgi:hypothetical protein